MAWPGTILFTRERTSHLEELQEKKEEEKEKEEKEEEKEEVKEKPCQEKMREIKIQVEKKPEVETKLVNPRVTAADIWPRRRRTDITELYQ